MRVLQSIQYLRVFAAMAVVVFHITGRLGRPVPVFAAGVDVFFVISGVIMWVVTYSKPVRPRRFIADRLVRIVPAYWVITLFMVGTTILAPGVFPHLRAPPLHVLLSLLFIPHASPNGGTYPILVPGWTLSYEMMFYALFAAALLLPGRLRAASIVATLAVLVMAGRAWPARGPVLSTLTNPQMLEFAVGIGLGVAATRGRLPSRPWGAALFAAGLAGFAAAPFFLVPVPQLLSWGVPAMCLVAGGLCWEAGGGLATSRPMLAVAAASYAIYLSHGLVISLCWKLVAPWSQAGFVVVSLVASVLVGLAFHRVIERPLTRLLRRVPRAVAGVPSAQSALP